jgi:hypothetical protein
VPEDTVVFAREMVPLEIIGPPVRPVPVATEVTVPVPTPEALIVIAPVLAEMAIPDPAVREVTPVLLTYTVPVDGDVEMPTPPRT